jgi:hypothetical protein
VGRESCIYLFTREKGNSREGFSREPTGLSFTGYSDTPKRTYTLEFELHDGIDVAKRNEDWFWQFGSAVRMGGMPGRVKISRIMA